MTADTSNTETTGRSAVKWPCQRLLKLIRSCSTVFPGIYL